MERRVREFIDKEQLLEPAAPVVLGVSGGADSTALLIIMQRLGYRCHAVHCNFHLRGDESNRDMQFVMDLCRRLDVELEICNYDTVGYSREHHVSIEMAARELRYADFERIRRQSGAQAICVAHHRDDSVETVLMNLMRGTGIRGLCGIRPRNGFIVRPLLCVSHRQITDYLDLIGQDFVTDSTNLEPDCTRNRIRLELLPLMNSIQQGATECIAQTASNLGQAYEIYADSIQAVAERVCVNVQANDCFDIDLQALASMGAVQRTSAVLFELLSPFGFTGSVIGQIAASTGRNSGRQFISASHTVTKDRDRLLLRPIASGFDIVEIHVTEGIEIPVPGGGVLSFCIADAGNPISRSPFTATLDADLTGTRFELRTAATGDSFHPFGMKGRKLLSDFMTDMKMSVPEKRSQLVLTVAGSGDIIWVVGKRSDNRYRVTASTRKQIVITLSKST